MKKYFLILTSALLCFNAFSQVPNYVPTNGLIAWWPFNGNANDESGNGNNGTVSGATLTTDRFGNNSQSFYFNGIDNYITITDNPTNDLNTNFTISLWIMPDIGYGSGAGPNGNNNQIISKWGLGGANNASFQVVINQNGNPIISTHNGITTTNINNSTIVPVITWHQILVTKNNQLMKLYFDGLQIDSINNAVNPQQSNYNLSIGREGVGNYAYVKGKIDDIGIWNRALTQCEVQDLYAGELNSTFVSAGLDQTICNGEQVTLSATNSQNYSWSNNVVNGISFSPTATQDFVVAANNNGCISTDTVTVTVNNPSTSLLTETALDSYTLNGQTYTQSGTYTQVIPNATGCDSTITLNLSLDFTGINETQTGFTIAPNPTIDVVTIISNDALNKEYVLLDPQGRKVLSGTLAGTTTQLDLSRLSRGNYLLQIGEKKTPIKLVKQ